jgi:hypothetical protein
MAGKQRELTELTVSFFPYVMFSSSLVRDGEWNDIVNDRAYPARLRPNRQGFCSEFDYEIVPSASYRENYGKKPGERIVLLTGGSAVHGVGATTNEQTIGYVLERLLNERQNKFRYRVLNLGMGSWIAFQQAICLDLWGGFFEPDWVIVMDGCNEAASYANACAGIGNPMFWPNMLYRIRGDNLRSPLAHYLGERSGLFRRLAGMSESAADADGLIVDYDAPDPRFQVKFPSPIRGLDEQLGFYIESQKAILRKFPEARYVLSSQPIEPVYFENYIPSFAARDPEQRQQFRKSLENELDAWMAPRADWGFERHSGEVWPGIAYFMARSALALEALTEDARARNWRGALYVNAELAFLEPREERRKYFMDQCHFTNEGHERLGEFYANIVLGLEEGQ